MTSNFYLKAAGFGLILSVPLLPALGYYYGTTWLTPCVVFILLPIARLLCSSDTSAAPSRIASMPWLKAYLYLVPLGNCNQ